MRPTVKLWELADLQNWYAFKSGDYISKSKTLNFRMSNIRPWWIVDIEYNKKFLPDEYAEIYKDFLLKDWDVVIAMTDMATSPKILAVPCIVNTWWYNVLLNQRVGKFFNVDETRIRKDFLWAVLSSSKIREGLASLWWWGLQINISKKQILDIQIPLPPLETQKAIVAKLDQIFAELDQTKSEIQKNLDNTDELRKSALNQAFQGDWEMKKLGEIWSLTRWKWFLKSDFVENWFPCIHYGQIHMKFDTAIDKNITYIPEELAKKSWIAEKNDVIIVITSEDVEWSCKSIAWLWNYPVAVWAHAAIYKHTQNPLFVSYYFQTSMFFKQKINYTHGSKVVEIKPVDVWNCTIPVPPLSEQEKIVEHLDQVSKEVKALKSQYQSQLDNLEELKKSVLDKAFRWEMG